MKKKNSKKIIRNVIIICSVLIFILLLLINLFKNTKKEDIKQEEIPTTNEDVITDYIRSKDEKERMQIYLANYIRLVENKEYSKAYEKLYPQFKQNYFPTQQLYISYIEQNYSELMAIQYEDIQRQGKYYILSVVITNLGDIETEKTQKFIIYENGLNDYYLSFQAK